MPSMLHRDMELGQGQSLISTPAAAESLALV